MNTASCTSSHPTSIRIRMLTRSRSLPGDGITNDLNCGYQAGGNMLEARVVKLESDVSHIRRDVEELKADVKSIVRNMAAVLEKLEGLKVY